MPNKEQKPTICNLSRTTTAFPAEVIINFVLTVTAAAEQTLHV